MGVSWVIQCPIADPAGRSLAQVYADYEKLLTSLGAERSGFFLVDSEPYYPNVNIPGLTSTLHLCHSSEYPMTSFVLVSETSMSGITMPYVVADRNFDQILSKLNAAFSPRSNLKIEAKGQKFNLHDFTIRLSNVVVAGSAKGVIVEVDYNCCFVPNLCQGLMREFCSSLLGQIGQQPPVCIARFKDSQSYAPIDTISQYFSIFLKYRQLQQQQQT
uniref:Mediator of RNA polymerase II transcription subunit 20 n=1 Tax=Romanomermis culicivorax TaxID=13658 RepID=A0A915IT09_ROMCU